MFDSIVNGHRNTTRRDAAPLLISWALHAIGIGAFLLVSLVLADERIPDVGDSIAAFVVAAPAPPPAPPPPPPQVAARPARPRVAREPRPALTPPPVSATPAPSRAAAPLEAPIGISPEPVSDESFATAFAGVPAGVIGGVVGAFPSEVPPPPLSPPREPVRTGGEIQAPALLKRVPPVYPPIAVNAAIEGLVILEATVGRDGRVEGVEVLRSVGLLEKAAIEAVQQWQYAPLLLNGKPERFVVTVTVSFNLS
jgi:protein TonB